MNITILDKANGKIFVLELEAEDFLTYTAHRTAAENGEAAVKVFMSQSFINNLANLNCQANETESFIDSAWVIFGKHLECTLYASWQNAKKNNVSSYDVIVPAAILLEIVTKDDYIKNNLKNF